MPNEFGELTDADREEVTFTVTCTMKRRWIQPFMSMLKYMEYCGKVGHSSDVGLFADGDGDFRPTFKAEGEGADVKQYSRPRSTDYGWDEVTFDADCYPEQIAYVLDGEGGKHMNEEDLKKWERLRKDGWEHKEIKN